MHWADVEAAVLGDTSLIATGITPSGPIHLGNMREILTGDAIRRAKGGTRLVYIADSIDPLRKVYPFLTEDYERYVRMPLNKIPCPCGEHESYAHHYLAPFFESVVRLGVECQVLNTHEMYAQGDYQDAVRKLMDDRVRVRDILSSVSGRQLEEDWYPYTPICNECGKMNAEVTGFSDPYVDYHCSCGHRGKADIRTDDGKLPWRCDWPARWWMLGVDCEPLGKDHAAAGGSWDTGVRIVKEIFQREPPHPVIYEWIQIKGMGAMSSSTGISVKVEDMLDIVGPEVVRFLLYKYKLQTHIDMDPGLGVIDVMDEYDAWESAYFNGSIDEDGARVYDLSQVKDIPREKPFRVPYRHLVNLVQIYSDEDHIWESVKEEHCTPHDRELFRNRLEQVRCWLDNFAPDMVKFSIQTSLPDIPISEAELAFLKSYLDHIQVEDAWAPEWLHQLVHEVAEKEGLSKGKAFGVFYKIFIGKQRGPKLGRFLAQLDRDFVIERLKEACYDG